MRHLTILALALGTSACSNMEANRLPFGADTTYSTKWNDVEIEGKGDFYARCVEGDGFMSPGHKACAIAGENGGCTRVFLAGGKDDPADGKTPSNGRSTPTNAQWTAAVCNGWSPALRGF